MGVCLPFGLRRCDDDIARETGGSGAAAAWRCGVLGVRVADWTARVGRAGPEWGAGAAHGVCAWRAACGGTCAAGEGKTGKAT